MRLHFVVDENFLNVTRLDAYVASQKNSINRSHLKSCAKEITVNGKHAKLSTKIKPLDVIDIEYDDFIPDDITPENIPLKIIYEDNDVTVINKERGMVTHPASGNWNGTLVNALLFHWGKEAVSTLQDENAKTSDILAARRPGIVHRLDKDTSGVIITAKNRDTEEWLQSQFASRRVRKEYIAIVRGKPPATSGDVRTQIIRDPKNRKRFAARDNTSEGKFARTIYHCVACYGGYSILRLRIKTGRTHQIRVHMKYLGCPILGDPIYSKKDDGFPNAPLMLHARLMEIRLPHQKTPVIFRAEIPSDFLEIYGKLKKRFPRIVPPPLKRKK